MGFVCFWISIVLVWNCVGYFCHLLAKKGEKGFWCKSVVCCFLRHMTDLLLNLGPVLAVVLLIRLIRCYNILFMLCLVI